MPLKEKFNGKLASTLNCPGFLPIEGTPVMACRHPCVKRLRIRVSPISDTELKQLD